MSFQKDMVLLILFPILKRKTAISVLLSFAVSIIFIDRITAGAFSAVKIGRILIINKKSGLLTSALIFIYSYFVLQDI